MRIDLYLLIWLTLCAGLSVAKNGASAVAFKRAPLVDMDPTQVSVLLEVANSWPSLKTRSTGAWTESNLQSACSSSSAAYGIVSCNDTGFVKELVFEDTTTTTGPLPVSIGSLEALISFASNGPISGSLPSSWSALTQLQTLQLANSRLTGNMPPSWSSLTSLETVVLNWASVSGAASSAALDWPSGILPLSSTLTSLTVTGYNFGSGNALPTEFFTSPMLLSLSLRNVIYDGSLPSSMLNNTKLVGVEIIGAPSLSSLNPIVPYLPNDWSTMSGLTTIHFENLPWLGNYPTSLPSNIIRLTLSNLPRLTGGVEVATVNYENLQVLIMDSLPSVGGAVPCPLHPESSSLSTLSVNDVGFSTLNASLFLCPVLQTLAITNMKAMTTQPLPNPTNMACGVESLNFSSSGFIGGVSDFISQNCSMSILDLSGNDLTGSIPSGWATDSFVTLDLSSNRLSGSLPPALGSLLASTASFNVSNNELIGGIPPEYYKTLRSFDISHNFFNVCADASDMAGSSFSPTLFCAIYPQESSMCDCADAAWPATCDFSVACNPTAPTTFVVPEAEPLSPFQVPQLETGPPPSEACHTAIRSACATIVAFFFATLV